MRGSAKRSKRSKGSQRPRRPKSARQAALDALVAIEVGKQTRLRDALDVDGLEPRDRDFAWELAQGAERMHRFLDFVLSQFVTKKLPKVAVVRSVLRLGAYQLLLMSRVPARAAVNETVSLLKDRRGFPNAVLRQLAGHVFDRAAAGPNEFTLPDGLDGPRCVGFDGVELPAEGTAERLAVRHGLPTFLVERWTEAHGVAAAESICRASAAPPSVYLRATAGVPEDVDFVRALAAQGVRVERLGDTPMHRVLEGAPFATAAFAAGWFMAQDPTAFAAARALDVQDGDRVLDVCAAPGTKTMVLAEAVGPSGRVFAFDVMDWKISFIRENAARLGLTDRLEYPETTVLDEEVDRALADVPCSNSGVLARRVEVRRRITEDAIRGQFDVQLGCLERALSACKPGGTVVYSTCSIEPEENRAVVDAALSDYVELVEDRLTLPDPAGGDGGYFAVLRLTR